MQDRYPEVTAAVRERLSEPAFKHCMRVADTAASLGAIYGVDPADAWLAGLLHDWDRELGETELVRTARDTGIAIDGADEAVPYLLHARTGAAAVAERFPELPAEVISAVANHTVGSATMGDLDCIVYVADMIEPGRTFKGVDELREAAGTVSLQDLFALAYQHSLMHLIRSRKRIHPDTVAVWNALAARDAR